MGRPTDKLAVGVVVLVLVMMLLSASAAGELRPDCDRWCGNLEIPYPFGMKEGCYLNGEFLITCNKTHHNPPKAFLRRSNIDVTNISINGELHIMQYIAKDCYTQNGLHNYSNSTLALLNFTISSTRNKFTVIGCDTYAYISGELEGESYKTGCMALCGNSTKTIRNGSCSGSGCCQLDIPPGLKLLNLEVESFNNHTEVLHFNPCGYAFLIEKDNFNFSSKYIANFTQDRVPMVLDWAIPMHTSSKADNKANCICGPNTKRVEFLSGRFEYRCECLKGFEGNPYLPRGCQDVDECKDESLNKCEYEHMCFNTPGNYTCGCPKNSEGDGTKEKGCIRNYMAFIKNIVGIMVGFVVLVIGSSWFCLAYQKWKLIQQKNKFFKKNGGLVLQQHLSQRQSQMDTLRIFTQEELKKATNKYDENAVVGKGGFGTVYKGVLDDGLTVAIKKSKLVDQSQTDQFINEVIVLSQINHRNVVTLLGCCLETQVPLLVYEFVTNHTLFDHIHNKTKHASLSWEARLKIASETAIVLSYLHSSASTPIIHRDIKSANILLDHNYTVKLSDFGASKLVPLDHTQISTMVQGTLGYLDPEYLLTSELTEKSDVYSFGIVLLELLTGKKAVRFDGPEVERNLAMYVLCAMKEDRLEEVVEKGMATEANIEQIKEVAMIAKECVRVKGEERPTMREVAMDLERLRLVHVQHFSMMDQTNLNSSPLVDSGNMNAMDHSINNDEILSHIHHGR